MEYGMPPQSGWGMGVERLLTLLTGQDNLRDVVLFPLMKSDTNESKKGITKLAVALINTQANLEKWQELNTIGHLTASLGARQGKSMFFQDTVETADGERIALNIQDAIMIKQISGSDSIRNLKNIAQKAGLSVTEFTREMMQTSDDAKVAQMTQLKEYSDIEHLGILVYGEKKAVEKLTKEYSLYN